MRQDTAATKAKIITVAEELFARKGVENVTLAEINQQSGQKNRSALQYHFGGKKELIGAIMDRHLGEINEERNRMLDKMQANGTINTRTVSEAIVVPLANRLNAPGGLSYIRITAQLFGNRDFPYLHQEDLVTNVASQRVWSFIRQAGVEFPVALQFTRVILMLSTLFQGLSNYAQICTSDRKAPEGVSHELFILDLIDSIQALLEKQPSRATLEQLQVAVDG